MSFGRLAGKIREMALIDEPPSRIAWAFAIGVFIGMSAFLGVHTVMGLIVAQVFRLNKLAMMVGVYITNPWTIVPIYTFCLVVGAKLMGIQRVLPEIVWSDLSINGFLTEFSHLLVPFIAGTTVVGFIAAVIGFFVVRGAVRRYRQG